MSKTYYYDGEGYNYINGKWYTTSKVAASLAAVSKLNQMLIAEEPHDDKTMTELYNTISEAKAANNYSVAINAIESAMERASYQEIRTLLPQLISCYRKLNNPNKAIDTFNSYIGNFGKRVWSVALFTSVAAAYCDIEEPDKAMEYANMARSLSGPNVSAELKHLYSKLQKEEKK